MDEDSTERPCLRRLKKHCMEQDGRGGNDIATLCQTKSPHGIVTQNHPPLAWSLAGDSQPRSLLKPLERSAADATQRAARPKDSAKAQPCILAVRRCRFFLYYHLNQQCVEALCNRTFPSTSKPVGWAVGPEKWALHRL